MQIAFFIYTILTGMMSALQSGSNNTLQKGLSAPWWTIAIVSIITAVVSLAGVIVTGDCWPTGHAVGAVPWDGWIGELFGFGFVIATVFASPKLGAGMFVALIVTASTVTSLVLDHFGLLSFDVHQAGWGRIAGGLLMTAGFTLIAIF